MSVPVSPIEPPLPVLLDRPALALFGRVSGTLPGSELQLVQSPSNNTPNTHALRILVPRASGPESGLPLTAATFAQRIRLESGDLLRVRVTARPRFAHSQQTRELGRELRDNPDAPQVLPDR